MSKKLNELLQNSKHNNVEEIRAKIKNHLKKIEPKLIQLRQDYKIFKQGKSDETM